MENRIRELRKDKKITQVQLSSALGVTQETISAYEHGSHYPSLDTLMKMADLFDASMDYIMGTSPIRERRRDEGDAYDERQETLLRYYRQLNERNQARLVTYAQGLSDGQG